MFLLVFGLVTAGIVGLALLEEYRLEKHKEHEKLWQEYIEGLKGWDD